MTILKNILEKTQFEPVWAELTTMFEGIDSYREGCESIFDHLRSAQPAKNAEGMVIRAEYLEDLWLGDDDEEDGEATLQVTGYIPGEEEGYAVGVKSPEDIAALIVEDDCAYSPEKLAALTIADIIYSGSAAGTAWGGGESSIFSSLYKSQVCIEESDTGLSLDALRKEMGLGTKENPLDYQSIMRR